MSNFKLDFVPSVWKTVASISPTSQEISHNHLVITAAMITIIPTMSKINPKTDEPYQTCVSGIVSFQYLTGTQATRFVLHADDEALTIGETWYLPTDTKFAVSSRKKKGTTTTALEVTLDFGPDASVPYDMIRLTMPFDGDQTEPPALMLSALEHTKRAVDASVDYLEKEAKKAAKKAAKAAARRRESYMSIDSPSS